MSVESVPSDAPRTGYAVTQIGFVVADLEAAMRAYHETFGWGPWRIFDVVPPRHRDVTLHGEPVEAGMRIAIATVGPIDIELIEPLEGPSQHREFIEAHGSGINHLLVRRYDGEGEELPVDPGSLGLAELQSGSFAGAAHYSYRAGGELGTVIEFVRGSAADGSVEPDGIYPRPAPPA